MQSFFQQTTAQEHVHFLAARNSRYSFLKTCGLQASFWILFQSRVARQGLTVCVERVIKSAGIERRELKGRKVVGTGCFLMRVDLWLPARGCVSAACRPRGGFLGERKDRAFQGTEGRGVSCGGIYRGLSRRVWRCISRFALRLRNETVGQLRYLSSRTGFIAGCLNTRILRDLKSPCFRRALLSTALWAKVSRLATRL